LHRNGKKSQKAIAGKPIKSEKGNEGTKGCFG